MSYISNPAAVTVTLSKFRNHKGAKHIGGEGKGNRFMNLHFRIPHLELKTVRDHVMRRTS